MFGQLVSPLAIMIILVCFQLACNALLGKATPHPEAQALGPFTQCTDVHGHHSDCVTLLYAPKGVPWVESVMQHVADTSGLTLGGGLLMLREYSFEIDDILCMGGDDLSWRGFFDDNSTIYNWIVANQNKTQNALIFTSAYGEQATVTIPQETGFASTLYLK